MTRRVEKGREEKKKKKVRLAIPGGFITRKGDPTGIGKDGSRGY